MLPCFHSLCYLRLRYLLESLLFPLPPSLPFIPLKYVHPLETSPQLYFVCVCPQSCLTSVTPWTVDYQAPLFMEFSRWDYWSGLSFPPPGYLPNPGTEHTALASSALAGRIFTTAPPGKSQLYFDLHDLQGPRLSSCHFKSITHHNCMITSITISSLKASNSLFNFVCSEDLMVPDTQ